MTAASQSLARIYRDAQRAQRDGDLEGAKARLLEVLRQAPDHAEALHSLGAIDVREGRLESAERLFRQAIALEPLKPSFINSLGNVLRETNRLDEAEEMYGVALRLQPDLAVAHSNLGELLMRRGRMQEAVESLLRALEIAPNHAGTYNNLGRALNNLGRLDEAADALRRAVVIRPDFAIAYDNLGHVQRARGDLEDAEDAFRHAIAIDPSLASAHHNLGTVLVMKSRLDEAIACLERARALRPRQVRYLLNLGTAYHTAGRLKDAAEVYRRALELAPEDAALHLNLGLVRVEQHWDEEAEASLRRALELDPGSPRIRAELAALYEETNRLDEMEEMIRGGLEAVPDDPRLNLEAAKLDRRAGRPEEGIERLSAFDPGRLDSRLGEQFHYQLGYLHDRAGKVEEAYHHLVQANHIASRTPRAAQADGRLFLGLLDRLREFFEASDPADWTPAPADDCPAPVFMLGFPRSGTTLLDLVLDGHTGLATLEERLTIQPVLMALEGLPGGYPGALPNLGKEDISRLQALYYEAVEEAGPAAGLVIDKMPIRTPHAGALWRLFPDARFIFCLRHPCDVVLSNFMQHYRATDAFVNFYTIEDSARVYDKVMGLWRLFVSRLPLNYHVVRYENLVEDLEAEARQVTDFLGVDWEPSALDYARRAKERGRINTMSYHQVTEGIYTRARYRWRAYADKLAPVLDVLAPHIEFFGYEQ